MLNTAEKMIEKVDYFACGYCTNNLKRVFKGFDKTIVNFYAGVFLIKHKKLGYILYDTGYSMDILKNNLKYFLYRFANPITLKREDMIDYQLKEKGIDKAKRELGYYPRMTILEGVKKYVEHSRKNDRES